VLGSTVLHTMGQMLALLGALTLPTTGHLCAAMIQLCNSTIPRLQLHCNSHQGSLL
jgi:hypothetical protein